MNKIIDTTFFLFPQVPKVGEIKYKKIIEIPPNFIYVIKEIALTGLKEVPHPIGANGLVGISRLRFYLGIDNQFIKDIELIPVHDIPVFIKLIEPIRARREIGVYFTMETWSGPKDIYREDNPAYNPFCYFPYNLSIIATITAVGTEPSIGIGSEYKCPK